MDRGDDRWALFSLEGLHSGLPVQVHITLNKNSVPGDKSAMTPGGVRIGTPALTTRGFDEADFELVADFLHRGVQIAQELKASTPAPAKMKEFRAHLAEQVAAGHEGITALRRDVQELAEAFPMPGN